MTGRDLASPCAAPRDAATVMLLRGPAAVGRPPLVLLLQRPTSASFAPGTQVFPGGSVDQTDRDPAWRELVAQGAEPSWDRRAGLEIRLAAIRETYEECGVLLASTASGRSCGAAEVGQLEGYRRRIRAGAAGLFRTMLIEAGLRPQVGELVFCADWITPAGLPRRFDTRFFRAPMPPDQEALPDPLGEHVSLRWVDPATALEEGRQGHCQLLPPTRAALAALAEAGSVQAALSSRNSQLVESVQPLLEEIGSERYPGLDLASLREGGA